MKETGMTRQVIDAQKLIVDGMLGGMITLWEQTEKATELFLQQAPWLPEVGKKTFDGWIKINKLGCENLKNAVAEGFNRLERCLPQER